MILEATQGWDSLLMCQFIRELNRKIGHIKKLRGRGIVNIKI
jgi:hypothetical protein